MSCLPRTRPRLVQSLMTAEAQRSRFQDMSGAALQMLALGESGRFEFKRDGDAVTVGLLAALANWVAADPARDVAHLLIGVEEVEDAATGLVSGVPCGLRKGLDRTVARVQDLASRTRPIPVDAFVVEEAVAQDHPFVRVEVRPSMPPHFDDEGRRQTRQGRSTRALTDDELLRMYLDREAGTFAARFRQTSEGLQAAVGGVGKQVDQIAEGIEAHIAEPIRRLSIVTDDAAEAAGSASSSADSAAASADSAEYEIRRLGSLVADLHDVVDSLHDTTPQSLAYQVARVRREIWWSFTVDTSHHTSARRDRLENRLRALLDRHILLDASINAWEVRVWEDVLKDRKAQRNGSGTQKWWDLSLRQVAKYMDCPAYDAPELPDLRAALNADEEHELSAPNSLTREFLRHLDDD